MTLCEHHYSVIHDLQRHDHIGDEDSTRVANSLAKQCPECQEGTP